MWKSFTNSEIAKSMQETLEKTGESLTKQAQSVAKKSSVPLSDVTSANGTRESVGSSVETPNSGPKSNTEDMGNRIKHGWGNMMEATKKAVTNARVAVEKEQTRLAARLNHPDRPKRRDPSLPLDVDALRDAEVVYITDRILTMSHPAMQSTVDTDITPARKLAAIGQLLHKRHDGRYMVWNLSEVEYDISILEDQVLLFSFPGSPSPPLGLLLKLLISMESWLKADERNVAVVHCLTGKGRTSTVVAALLCWMGEANFRDVRSALDYIGKCKRCSPDELTIPSQRRYVQYFANMLDGVRPSQPPLMLKRIIMSEAPRFAKGPPREGTSAPLDDARDKYDPGELIMGCAPYLQIFKAGQLVFTTAASLHYNQDKDELPFCQVADGAISFHVENVVQGDVLIRCRHLSSQGQRVSMFRAAFHTGYVPPNVMRLTKAQLDGACDDKRFPDDFFLDLIFEACDAEMASKHLSGKADAICSEESNDNDSQNEACERREKGTLAGAGRTQPQISTSGDSQGPTVTASAYDSMLHRDSRFWDVIASRRQQHAQTETDNSGDDDPFWGPTIGRRRKFESEPTKDEESGESGTTSEEVKSSSALPTFSIGGDFDFMQSKQDTDDKVEPVPIKEKEEPKERDELMEALMAIDDETLSPVAEKKTRVLASNENHPGGAVKKDLFNEKIKDEEESPGQNESREKLQQDKEAPSYSIENERKESKETDAIDEAADLLGSADLDLDLGLDEDVDAFLAAAGAGDIDIDDTLDFEDDDLDDLENFLTSK